MHKQAQVIIIPIAYVDNYNPYQRTFTYAS